MMRFKAILLAAAVSAALPAMAQAQERPDRGDRSDGQRGDRGQRPQFDGQRGGDRQQADQQRQVADQQRQAVDQQRQIQDQQRQGTAQQPRDAGNRQGFDRGRNDNRGDYRRDDNRRPDFRPGDNRGSDFRGQQFGRDDRRFGNSGRDWRQDRRYDWRGYRNTNRNVFRAGRYVAPRGWSSGYRRFSIGVSLPSIFFGSQYWIADPWTYRLPPVDGPFRWIRYYNDVLLIDLRSGQVVDEIPDFFW